MNVFGLPQPLSGSELVTIHQEQNGQLAECSMPISMLTSYIMAGWAKSLSTTEPTAAGVAWNNDGVISIS